MSFLLLNHAAALFLTSLTAFVIGIFVLFKSRDNKTNLIYSIWSLSVAWWSFFEGLAITSDSYFKAILFTKFFWAAILLIAISTTHFVTLFLGIKGKEFFIKIGYILSAFFAVISFTPLMVSDVRQFAYLKYWPKPEIFVYLNAFIFIVYVVYQIYQLYKAYKISTGIKRNQIAYVFWASLLGYTGGLSNYLMLFIYIPIFQPFATYLLVSYSILVGLAILKYQLMDITIIIKKAFFYSVIIALISGAIFGISFLNSWFAEHFSGLKPWMIPLFAGIVAFIIGDLFWRKSEEVDKLKYEFITVATHKLRTPLTEIKWGLEELRKETTERGRKLVDSLNASNSRLIELTDELLVVAKTESQQYKYQLKPEDLGEITKDIINSFQSQIKEKNAKLSISIEPNLPKINADRIRIGSVIQILLENAVNYTGDAIDINLKKDNGEIVFSVKDNGIGISKEDQSYIFSKFYRTHDAYKTETEGSGIGLFLAKSIIEKHGGKIGVISEGKGKGSEFWFKLRTN